MSIITITTDYGLKDHFVGAIKGKILSDAKNAIIVDISHDISPFNSTEASYIISSCYNNFPKGTVHLIGVDAEQNRETQHIAMLWNDHYFICADNGILSMLIQNSKPQELVQINFPSSITNNVSDIDILIKAATHLSLGGNIIDLGTTIYAIKEVTELTATVSEDLNIIKGYVVYIDNFGNVVTNISQTLYEQVAKGRNCEIRFKTNRLTTLVKKYSDIATSDKYPIKNYEGLQLALFNQAGFLEIAIFRSNPKTVGSAKSLLGLDYRDVITVAFV